MQHDSRKIPEINIDSKEGQRRLSCCNEAGNRCPSLVFNTPEEEELAYKEYANLITELFLEQYEKRNPE